MKSLYKIIQFMMHVDGRNRNVVFYKKELDEKTSSGKTLRQNTLCNLSWCEMLNVLVKTSSFG